MELVFALYSRNSAVEIGPMQAQRPCYASSVDRSAPAPAPNLLAAADRAPEDVDRSLILWMLSLTPTERLAVLQQFADQAAELQRESRRVSASRDW